jgi:hypothetical protein
VVAHTWEERRRLRDFVGRKREEIVLRWWVKEIKRKEIRKREEEFGRRRWERF